MDEDMNEGLFSTFFWILIVIVVSVLIILIFSPQAESALRVATNVKPSFK